MAKLLDNIVWQSMRRRPWYHADTCTHAQRGTFVMAGKTYHVEAMRYFDKDSRRPAPHVTYDVCVTGKRGRHCPMLSVQLRERFLNAFKDNIDTYIAELLQRN